jgi:hypothetical protein
MRRALSHFSANAVGYLALFVAMSGGAYAVTRAPAGSVNSQAIINGQVKEPDIHKKAVTASKLGSRSVTASKLAPDSVTGGNVVESTLGPVPNAAFATNAANATNATNATNAANAANATTATNAQQLGGQSPSAFLPASTVTTGAKVQTATAPANDQTLLQRGPLTLIAECQDFGAGNHEVEVFATSSQAGFIAYGGGQQALPAGSPQLLDGITNTAALYKEWPYSYSAASGAAFGGGFGLGINLPAGDCVTTAHAIG